MQSKIRRRSVARALAVCAFTALLASCGGSSDSSGLTSNHPTPTPTTYTVSVSVSGLTGSGLVLQVNGASNLAVSGNGSATFAASFTTGTTYAVAVATQPSGQTCTVANGSGTIGSANVSNVTVTCSAATFTVSVSVSGLSGTLVLQLNGGSNLSVSANGSATFATGLASGTGYSVTVLTQPSGQLCSVTNATGTIAANVTNVSVTCVSTPQAQPEFLYATTANGSLLGFAIDTLTGAITALPGSPFATQLHLAADSLIVSHLASTDVGNLLYGTVNQEGIEAWAVNATSGGVTAVAGNLFGGSGGFGPLAITGNAKFAFVASQDATQLVGFSIGADGSLATTNAGAAYPFTLATDPRPTASAMTPNGRFLYVAAAIGAINSAPPTLTGFVVDTLTGALTKIPGTITPADFVSLSNIGNTTMTVSPNGQFLMVTSPNLSRIVVYAINQSTGALTAVPGSPFTTAGRMIGPVAFDPTGAYMYFATQSGLAGYAVNPSTGALSVLSGIPTIAATAFRSVVVDRKGKFLYAAAVGSNSLEALSANTPTSYGINAYSIDRSTGSLTLLTGSPFAVTSQASRAALMLKILK